MNEKEVDVSYLLVTNRDFQHYAARVIPNLRAASKGLKYEILIYSPSELAGEDIKWYKDKTQNGCVAGFNYLVKQARGKYVLTCVDDHVLGFYVERAITFLESKFFEDRKIRICAVATGGNTCIPSPSRPSEFGPVPHIQENNIRILGFPFINRQDVMDHMGGYLFHPDFKHHHGDNFLPYWLWKVDGIHFECPTTPFYSLYNEPSTISKYDKEDFDTFCKLIKKIEVDKELSYV